jgi:hypothetical protein
MPSFAAPTTEEAGAEPAWQGADPAQIQQMQAMQEQMAAMQAQLQQQALQQAPPATATPAPTAPAPAAPNPGPAGSQQLSGYRRPPDSAAPTPAPQPTADAAAPPPSADLSGHARPSVEGSPYEAVLADERSASAFGSESSPFARLEAEQAAAATAADTPASADDGGVFRQEPQRLVSPEEAPAPAEEEPGEVDRVMLAKEFSGLLQVGEDVDED